VQVNCRGLAWLSTARFRSRLQAMTGPIFFYCPGGGLFDRLEGGSKRRKPYTRKAIMENITELTEDSRAGYTNRSATTPSQNKRKRENITELTDIPKKKQLGTTSLLTGKTTSKKENLKYKNSVWAKKNVRQQEPLTCKDGYACTRRTQRKHTFHFQTKSTGNRCRGMLRRNRIQYTAPKNVRISYRGEPLCHGSEILP